MLASFSINKTECGVGGGARVASVWEKRIDVVKSICSVFVDV